jgi:hypothetical protein
MSITFGGLFGSGSEPDSDSPWDKVVEYDGHIPQRTPREMRDEIYNDLDAYRTGAKTKEMRMLGASFGTLYRYAGVKLAEVRKWEDWDVDDNNTYSTQKEEAFGEFLEKGIDYLTKKATIAQVKDIWLVLVGVIQDPWDRTKPPADRGPAARAAKKKRGKK